MKAEEIERKKKDIQEAARKLSIDAARLAFSTVYGYGTKILIETKSEVKHQ